MGWIATRFATAFAGLLLACAAYGAQRPANSAGDCAAPSYFGICDPYVPGTIIRWSDDKKSVDVIDTWPAGPAEKAGICPGDQIIAVNGIPVPGHTFEQILKQLVSPVPSPIALNVARGKQEMHFHFDRARETTLAQLSHQKYVFRRLLMHGLQPSAVPADETPEEIEELGRFYDGVDRRVGFKLIEGIDVPQGTPEEQVRKLRAIGRQGPEHARWVGVTAEVLGKNGYSTGFDAVVLKNPQEVLVNRVLTDSPAQRAGVFPGDQILEISGHPVSGLTTAQLSDLISKPDEPREVVLKVRRGLSTLTPKIQTQKLKEIDDRTPYQSLSGYLGLEVVYVENPREAIVDRLDYPLPAFEAGLHPGDRILAVNAVPIEQITRQQLAGMLQPRENLALRLDVLRLGKKLDFPIKPSTPSEVESKIGRKITTKGPVPDHCPGS